MYGTHTHTRWIKKEKRVEAEKRHKLRLEKLALNAFMPGTTATTIASAAAARRIKSHCVWNNKWATEKIANNFSQTNLKRKYLKTNEKSERKKMKQNTRLLCRKRERESKRKKNQGTNLAPCVSLWIQSEENSGKKRRERNRTQFSITNDNSRHSLMMMKKKKKNEECEEKEKWIWNSRFLFEFDSYIIRDPLKSGHTFSLQINGF